MKKVERNSEFGFRNAECRLFSRQCRGALTFRNPHSEFRIGLTLIELLVVIVILMTLVGGVIPVLSPNNEARKIRAASRGLQTYVLQAQARAARTGRAAGIAFRETSAGSGVALDVFQIEIPPLFTGFSSSSSAIFYRDPDLDTYEVQLGEGFGENFDSTGGPFVPPLFTKNGDLMEVGTALFRLERKGIRNRDWLDVNGVEYFLGVDRYRQARLIAGSAPPTFALDYEYKDKITTHPNGYRIIRQPVNTSESPYTLPAGVAIDMHASGTEGGAKPTLFMRPKDSMSRSEHDTIKQIGIMFSPSGGVDSVHYNGRVFGPNALGDTVETPITDASRVLLLLGRVENVLDEDAMDPASKASPTLISKSASDEQLAEMQERINWLNLDSRWLAIDARSGRTAVNDNTFVDARNLPSGQEGQVNTNVQRALDQLDAARQFARQMKSDSGR